MGGNPHPIDIGGFGAATTGPLRRVGFGSSYAHRYLSEVFRENLEHFPILLPIVFHEPLERFAHLRLHNGTIWRWNRPLVGFDSDGAPTFGSSIGSFPPVPRSWT